MYRERDMCMFICVHTYMNIFVHIFLFLFFDPEGLPYKFLVSWVQSSPHQTERVRGQSIQSLWRITCPPPEQKHQELVGKTLWVEKKKKKRKYYEVGGGRRGAPRRLRSGRPPRPEEAAWRLQVMYIYIYRERER